MKFKGTFIFAVAVAVLVAFAFYEFEKMDVEKKSEATQGHLLKDFDIETVNKVSISTPNGQFAFELKDNQWSVLAPFQDLTDDDIIDSFLRSVSSQTTEEVPIDGEINWSKYGLDKPQSEIKITTQDGKLNHILVGSVRSFNEGFYLRREGHSQLLVANKSFETNINKTNLDFHSKKIRMPKGVWTEVEFKSNDKTVPLHERSWRFINTEKGWQNDKNKNWLIAQNQFMELDRALKDLKANEVTSESKSVAALKVSHLNSPDKILTIKTAEKKIDIIFSAEKESSVFYTSSDNMTVFKTSLSQLNAIFKKSSDFRDKKYPFQFDNSLVQSLRIKDEIKKTDHTYKRTDLIWSRDGLTAGESVNASALTDVINGLKSLEINDFPQQKSLKNLNNIIELKNGKDELVFKIEFGALYKVNNLEHYIVKTNTATEILGISKSTLQALLDKKFIDTLTDKKEK